MGGASSPEHGWNAHKTPEGRKPRRVLVYIWNVSLLSSTQECPPGISIPIPSLGLQAGPWDSPPPHLKKKRWNVLDAVPLFIKYARIHRQNPFNAQLSQSCQLKHPPPILPATSYVPLFLPRTALLILKLSLQATARTVSISISTPTPLPRRQPRRRPANRHTPRCAPSHLIAISTDILSLPYAAPRQEQQKVRRWCLRFSDR
jgi:hypothetical protein